MLLIRCLLLLLLLFDPGFVIQYFVSFLVFQSSRWGESVGCFTFIVFLVSCGCCCSLSLPHGAVVWSAACDCGISWSCLPIGYMLLYISHHLQTFFRDGSRGGTGGTDTPLKKIGQYWRGSSENHKYIKPAFNVGPTSSRQRNAI